MYNLSVYKRIISTALKAGYRLTDFIHHAQAVNEEHSDPLLILRYDVDYSLAMAWKIAKANLELGIYGTFFVRNDSHTYNVYTKENREYLRKIHKAGQLLGYHCEITDEDAASTNLPERTMEQIEHLSKGLGLPILPVISWHNCPDHLREMADLLVGSRLICCYQSEFYKDMLFLSDVDMKRHETDFILDLNDKPKGGVHVQFNPTNWVASGVDMPTTLLRIMKRLYSELEHSFQKNQVWKRNVSDDFRKGIDQVFEKIEDKLSK